MGFVTIRWLHMGYHRQAKIGSLQANVQSCVLLGVGRCVDIWMAVCSLPQKNLWGGEVCENELVSCVN
jgi:hypothetical protein